MAILSVLLAVLDLQAAGGTPDCPANGILEASIPVWGNLATMTAVHGHLIAGRDTIEHLDLRVYLSGCSEWPDCWNLPFALTSGNSSITRSSEEQEQEQ